MVHETLVNAPIVEAVVDLRVELAPDSIEADVLAAIEGEFAEFSQKQNQLHYHLDPDAATSVVSIASVLLQAQGEPVMVNGGPRGFAASQMRPYGDWSSFRDSVRRLWERYRRVVRPVRCVRLGLRYVNKIDIAPDEEVGQVLTWIPVAPPLLAPDGFLTATTSFVAPFADRDAAVKVILHLPQRRDVDSGAQVLLDIDAFRQTSLGADDEAIWEGLEVLRGIKNEVFFGSITNRARERFRNAP